MPQVPARAPWGCQVRKCFGIDFDDLFAFQTTKRVRVRDKRLGCLYIISLFGVFVYIGVYTLAYNLAYLTFISPSGVVRFKLQQPTAGDCGADSPGCRDAFPRTTELHYCCQSECPPLPRKGPGACSCKWRPSFPNYQCAFLDGDSAGVIQRGGVFIVTKTREQREVLNSTCTSANATECGKLWSITQSSSTFTAGIENFTLLLDHSAQVPALNFSRQARDLVGFLSVPSTGSAQDELCSRPNSTDWYHAGRPTRKAPCFVKPRHPAGSGLDFFAVADLLTAAGVELDSESYHGSGHSARYEGMTMIMNIVYYNAAPWRGELATPAYYYEVSADPRNAYGQHDVSWDSSRTGRTVRAQHGILIQASVGGRIASFSFNALVLQLAASMALITGVTFVVNFLAMYVLKYRSYYSAAMVATTGDFSALAALDRLSLEALAQACQQRGLADSGERVDMVNRLLSDGFQPEQAPPAAGQQAWSRWADSLLAQR